MRISDKWLSVAEVAELLGLSTSAVRQRIYSGEITAKQHTPGGKYLIRESEAERILVAFEAGTLTPTAA